MLNIAKTLKIAQKRYDDINAKKEKLTKSYEDAIAKNNNKLEEIVTQAKDKYTSLNAELKLKYDAQIKELKPQLDERLKALNEAKKLAEALKQFNEQQNI